MASVVFSLWLITSDIFIPAGPLNLTYFFVADIIYMMEQPGHPARTSPEPEMPLKVRFDVPLNLAVKNYQWKLPWKTSLNVPTNNFVIIPTRSICRISLAELSRS